MEWFSRYNITLKRLRAEECLFWYSCMIKRETKFTNWKQNEINICSYGAGMITRKAKTGEDKLFIVKLKEKNNLWLWQMMFVWEDNYEAMCISKEFNTLAWNWCLENEVMF